MINKRELAKKGWRGKKDAGKRGDSSKLGT
jgi:hypothetical protein